MGETSEDHSEHPREFPRFEVNAYVDYTGNEVLLFHRIQNISLGGVCIQTTGVEEVGTLVDLDEERKDTLRKYINMVRK